MKQSFTFRARLLRRMLSLMRNRFAAMSFEESRRLGNFGSFPLPKGTRVRPVVGIAGQWIDFPDRKPNGVILYLHGGGYIQNTPKVHHSLVARIAMAANMRAVYLDYRLAPEHPFPAALDDTMSAYTWLLDQNIPPSNIILVGDSAGGGLALATMVKGRDSGLPLPVAAILLSPLCDLTLSNPYALADCDPIYPRETLLRAGRLYAGNVALDDPLLSPINADLHNLPPILIQAGGVELLRDDAHLLATRIKTAGSQVQLSIYQGLWHVWQIYPPLMIPESRRAVQEMADFIRAYHLDDKASES